MLPLHALVTALILLNAELAVRGKLPDDLGVLADRILNFLGMLFVPAGVGVITYLGILKTEALPILAAVIGGTATTLFVAAIVASRFGNEPEKSNKYQPVTLNETARDVYS